MTRLTRFATTLLALAVAPAASAEQRYVDPIFTATKTHADVVYGSSFNPTQGAMEEQELDVYEPVGDTETNRPAIVFTHGGSFISGNKGGGYALPFAQRGYVAASINYRLRPGTVIFPDLFVEALTTGAEVIRDAQVDLQGAIRWMRAHAEELRIDPDRIIAVGASAGAITSLEAGFNPDTQPEADEQYEVPFGAVPNDVAAVVSISGASDVRRIEPGAPPVQLFHGTTDITVPFALAVETCAGTIALGNKCEPVIWPYSSHGQSGPRQPEVLARSTDFLCRHVVSECDPGTIVPASPLGEPGDDYEGAIPGPIANRLP